MTKTATGTYTYTFTPPENLIVYTAWVKIVYKRRTNYYEILYTAHAADLIRAMPSEILWEYLVETAGLFTDPDDGGEWPLYINELPDGNGVDNTTACVSDTVGLYDGKSMDGTIDQHYGIQIRLRAFTEASAYGKAATVESTLAPISNVDVVMGSDETYRINNISQAGSIIRMGPDEKRRINFTINYLFSYKEV
jgi:hypothetical protein